MECSICQEPVTDAEIQNGTATVLPCGHPFHDVCIQPVVNTSNKCPMCRAQIDPNLPVGPSPYDADNFAPAVDGGDGVGPVGGAPTGGVEFDNVWVLPGGSLDYNQAVIQNATIEISGGIGGGYIDVTGGTGNTAQDDGSTYDFLLSDGTLAVMGATVYTDVGGGQYIFSFGPDMLRL